MGNSEPVFVSRSAEIVDMRQMGSNREHLRVKFRNGRNTFDAVGWGLGENAEEIYKFKYLDIVYNLELNHWNGETNLRLTLQDFSPAS
jgi:single-stranded-DNA-specific exonuclease